MFCAISGVAPEHPVVSKLSGHVFEQSVVEKYIESTGKCPVTGEPLEAGDLLPLKSSSAVKPRPVAAASIPGMLTLFQNEWDALMLETYTLKQQLETVRQELGHALYQHDAACRVIARLVKERDDARAALAEARAGALPPAPAQPAAAAPPTASAAAGGGGAMDVEAVPPAAGLSAELSAKFDATAKGLSKGRKKRQMAAGYADAQAIAGYALLGASTPAAHAGGVVCLDAHATERVLASGGADGRLVLATCDGSYASVQQVEAHAARVTSVCLHPSRPLVLSSAADGSARVSSTAGGAAVDLARVHKASVNSCTLHASGEYCVTASDDRSWALFDLESGSCVLRHQSDAASAGYSCAAFHPDGLILGTAMGAAVAVWDVKSQANAHTFEGHTANVCSLAFSENGYYLATGAADATVKLWDLRKLKNFQTLQPAGGAAVHAVRFDYSGGFLAVGSAEFSVFETKTWGCVTTFGDHAASVSGVAFGCGAAVLACSSADGVVKVYGSSS